MVGEVFAPNRHLRNGIMATGEADDGLVYLRDVADIEPPRDRYDLCVTSIGAGAKTRAHTSAGCRASDIHGRLATAASTVHRWVMHTVLGGSSDLLLRTRPVVGMSPKTFTGTSRSQRGWGCRRRSGRRTSRKRTRRWRRCARLSSAITTRRSRRAPSPVPRRRRRVRKRRRRCFHAQQRPLLSSPRRR